jgi:signal transduction histidine kinase
VSLRHRHPDAFLVLAFLAGHLLERLVNPESEGTAAANVLGALALTVPLLWLRRRPLVAVIGLVAGGVLNQEIATGTDALFVVLVTLIVVGFTITRHRDGAERWVPIGVGAVALGVSEAVFGSGDVAFVLLLLGGGAVGGALVRGRAELTRELAERTHELEALHELRERDAVLAERRRIARELHDVVAHTVSVMVVQAGGARRQVDRDPERALAALDQVRVTGEETLVELQRLFGLLHAGERAAGLADLPALVARTRAAGLEVELDVEGEPGALDAEADLAAYRLVQEALTNTIKHAGPASARVEVRWEAGAVDVRVSDTGWGSAGPRGDGSRRGLVGMRERMELFGGEVQAGPLGSGGYEVRARLPLAREEVHVA